MNYLFLTKTAFFNGLSENEIKTILNCLGAYQKSFKKYVKNLKNILTKTQKDVKIRKYQATDKKV